MQWRQLPYSWITSSISGSSLHLNSSILSILSQITLHVSFGLWAAFQIRKKWTVGHDHATSAVRKPKMIGMRTCTCREGNILWRSHHQSHSRHTYVKECCSRSFFLAQISFNRKNCAFKHCSARLWLLRTLLLSFSLFFRAASFFLFFSLPPNNPLW